MYRTYLVQNGDTLQAIARKYLGDQAQGQSLADFNGLRNPEAIFPGQLLHLPSRQDLSQDDENSRIPHGLQNILGTFGQLYEYLRADGTLDPAWETDQIARIALPFPLTLSWDTSRRVHSFPAHRKLTDIFAGTLREVERRGLANALRTFGGCYCYRPKRGNSKLSPHAWGIAIDLNPETNQMGTPGDMHPEVVTIFKSFGFVWGGDWSGRVRDPMHFQYCSGY